MMTEADLKKLDEKAQKILNLRPPLADYEKEAFIMAYQYVREENRQLRKKYNLPSMTPKEARAWLDDVNKRMDDAIKLGE